MTYIYLNDTIYPVDTDDQRETAREALRAEGRQEAAVYTCPYDTVDEFETSCADGEAYKNGQVLFA